MNYIDPNTTDVDECIAITLRMLAACKELSYGHTYPDFEPTTFGYDKGKKYSRVWYQKWNREFMCADCRALPFNPDGMEPCTHERKVTEGQRFVAFFVQRDTGDVWKANGWKAPALNFTRGNIMSPAGRKAITFDKLNPETLHFYPAF